MAGGSFDLTTAPCVRLCSAGSHGLTGFWFHALSLFIVTGSGYIANYGSILFTDQLILTRIGYQCRLALSLSALCNLAIEFSPIPQVIFCMMKRAIPAFDFWEWTESTRVVDAMACSAVKGCFDNFSRSLKGEGVFLAC